jgi:WD40 repeat protein
MFVICFAFHPRKLIFAAGGGSNDVKLFVLDPNGQVIRRLVLSGHTNDVYDIKFLENDRLTSASEDNLIKIWDTNSLTCLQTIRAHEDSVRSLCLHPSGRIMVSASFDNKLIVWWLSDDNSSATQIQVLEGHHYGFEQVRFDPSGRQLVSSGSNKLIVWE